MLSQIKLGAYEAYLQTLKVEQRILSDNSSVFFLLADDGAVCGIYDTEVLAYEKLPIVAYNLYRGKIPAKLVVKPRYNNKRR